MGWLNAHVEGSTGVPLSNPVASVRKIYKKLHRGIMGMYVQPSSDFSCVVVLLSR